MKNVSELKHSKVFVFSWPYLCKNLTHVFKHTADLSMQMHLISHSLHQVLLVNCSCLSTWTASLMLYLCASLIAWDHNFVCYWLKLHTQPYCNDIIWVIGYRVVKHFQTIKPSHLFTLTPFCSSNHMTLALILIAAHMSLVVPYKSALLTYIPASDNSTTELMSPSRAAVMKWSTSFSLISALFYLYSVFHLESLAFGQKPHIQ